MRKELDDKLVSDFPVIFRDRNGSPMTSAMAQGFPADKWYDTIREICEEIVRIRNENGVVIIATQVKEKFGGLRFYFRDTDEGFDIDKDAVVEELWHFISKREVL